MGNERGDVRSCQNDKSDRVLLRVLQEDGATVSCQHEEITIMDHVDQSLVIKHGHFARRISAFELRDARENVVAAVAAELCRLNQEENKTNG